MLLTNFNMKIYRYEKSDGGGPWCTLDGKLRSHPNEVQMNDPYVYGCSSLTALNEYFQNRKDVNILADCILKIYDIPEEEVIISTRQVLFPKTYIKQQV